MSCLSNNPNVGKLVTQSTATQPHRATRASELGVNQVLARNSATRIHRGISENKELLGSFTLTFSFYRREAWVLARHVCYWMAHSGGLGHTDGLRAASRGLQGHLGTSPPPLAAEGMTVDLGEHAEWNFQEAMIPSPWALRNPSLWGWAALSRKAYHSHRVPFLALPQQSSTPRGAETIDSYGLLF